MLLTNHDFKTHAFSLNSVPGSVIIIRDWILENEQNVTPCQLHFLGPANSHTYTLSMHCCINGLS